MLCLGYLPFTEWCKIKMGTECLSVQPAETLSGTADRLALESPASNAIGYWHVMKIPYSVRLVPI